MIETLNYQETAEACVNSLLQKGWHLPERPKLRGGKTPSAGEDVGNQGLISQNGFSPTCR